MPNDETIKLPRYAEILNGVYAGKVGEYEEMGNEKIGRIVQVKITNGPTVQTSRENTRIVDPPEEET